MLMDELEQTLLDQIEKLNDDSLTDCEDPAEAAEKARVMIDKSRAIGELADKVVSLNRLKLDVYHEANLNGGLYEKLLGIDKK